MLWQHTVNLATQCSSHADCSYANTEANQMGVTAKPAREWDSCRLCHSSLARFLWTHHANPVVQIEPTSLQAVNCLHFCLQKSPDRQPRRRTGCKSKHRYDPNHAMTRERSFKTKSSSIQIRANIDICLCCLFQRLVFSERREMLVKDGQNGTDSTITV